MAKKAGKAGAPKATRAPKKAAGKSGGGKAAAGGGGGKGRMPSAKTAKVGQEFKESKRNMVGPIKDKAGVKGASGASMMSGKNG